MPSQNSSSALPQSVVSRQALPYGLIGMGQSLAQAGAPSQYPNSFFSGLGQAGAGFSQGVHGYQHLQREQDLYDLQRQEADQRKKKLDLETRRFESDEQAAASQRAAITAMAQTPPQSWTGNMQSWQNLVLTDTDSAAKWYEPRELETLTEYQGGQQRTAFYDPMTGQTVKAGDWAPRWQPTTPAQQTEFGAWYNAFQRDNNRPPTAKEIADRDKRLNESIEYKNVIENGKVSTLPVGPMLDAAVARGAVITGTTTQLTEGQAKAGMQFAISKQANERLDKVERVLTRPLEHVAAQFGTVGNYAKSPEYQQAEQAARAMAEMFLRATTGAAATEPEIERVKQTILPQPGNDPGTIAQKKAQRQMIVETLRLMSGSMAGQVEALDLDNAPAEPEAATPSVNWIWEDGKLVPGN